MKKYLFFLFICFFNHVSGINNALNNAEQLTTEQISALEVIAHECPYVYGPAVYQARAMLAPYDTLGTNYTNACEIVNNPTDDSHRPERVQTTVNFPFNVFPNPNNGAMTITYSLNTGDVATFKLFDFTGRAISSNSLSPSSTSLNISEKTLSNGIYFYRITVNNALVKTDKLVIIK